MNRKEQAIQSLRKKLDQLHDDIIYDIRNPKPWLVIPNGKARTFQEDYRMMRNTIDDLESGAKTVDEVLLEKLEE